MATVLLTTLLNEVQPFVADCPTLLATHAIRNAAIEFCHKTQLWTYDVPAVDVVAGTPTYILALPTETVMVELLQVWNEDMLIGARSPDDLTRFYRHVDWRSEEGTPMFHYREVPSTVRLVPTPVLSVTGGLKCRIALSPSRAGTLIEEELAERFAETIARGALARLQGLAGQPFFNPGEAAKNERRFAAGITDARIKANRGYARAQSGVQFNGGFL